MGGALTQRKHGHSVQTSSQSGLQSDQSGKGKHLVHGILAGQEGFRAPLDDLNGRKLRLNSSYVSLKRRGLVILP